MDQGQGEWSSRGILCFPCGFLPSLTRFLYSKVCVVKKEVTQEADDPLKSSWNLLLQAMHS